MRMRSWFMDTRRLICAKICMLDTRDMRNFAKLLYHCCASKMYNYYGKCSLIKNGRINKYSLVAGS